MDQWKACESGEVADAGRGEHIVALPPDFPTIR